MFSTYIDSAVNVALQAKSLEKAVDQAIKLLLNTIRNSKPVLICGNGGSAADSQHIAAELVGRFKKERPALNAIALTADTATLTALGNDYGYESVFGRQVEAYGQPGACMIAISTSGNSANVLLAAQQAKNLGMHIISLTGQSGGKLKNISDVLLNVPSTDTAHIQEVHTILYHYICQEIERIFFVDKKHTR